MFIGSNEITGVENEEEATERERERERERETFLHFYAINKIFACKCDLFPLPSSANSKRDRVNLGHVEETI